MSCVNYWFDSDNCEIAFNSLFSRTQMKQENANKYKWITCSNKYERCTGIKKSRYYAYSVGFIQRQHIEANLEYMKWKWAKRAALNFTEWCMWSINFLGWQR